MDESSREHGRRRVISSGAEALGSRIRRAMLHESVQEETVVEEGDADPEGLSVSTLSEIESPRRADMSWNETRTLHGEDRFYYGVTPSYRHRQKGLEARHTTEGGANCTSPTANPANTAINNNNNNHNNSQNHNFIYSTKSVGRNFFRTLSANTSSRKLSRSGNSGKSFFLTRKFIPSPRETVEETNEADQDPPSLMAASMMHGGRSTGYRIRSAEELMSLQDHMDGLGF